MKEQQIASANHIVSFYNEIQNLLHNYAIYLNILLESKFKYANNDDQEIIKSLSDPDKAQLTEIAQALRYSLHKINVIVPSMLKSLKNREQDITRIRQEYIEATKLLLPEQEKLTLFVTSCYQILTDDVMQNLLVTSQDIVNQVYNG